MICLLNSCQGPLPGFPLQIVTRALFLYPKHFNVNDIPYSYDFIVGTQDIFQPFSSSASAEMCQSPPDENFKNALYSSSIFELR